MNRLFSATFVTLAAGIAVILLPAAGAAAHADLESSMPADGEVLAESPAAVDAYFSQEMARSEGLPTLVVVNEAGDVLSEESVLDDADRTHISAALPPALPEGRYTVIWHTLSDEDGEEAQGAFHFYVGAGPGETPPPADSDETVAPTGTLPPAEVDGGDDGGVSPWLVVIGVAGGLVAGAAGGFGFLRRRGGR
jgi:methionine-rich copper-binding protein CopC